MRLSSLFLPEGKLAHVGFSEGFFVGFPRGEAGLPMAPDSDAQGRLFLGKEVAFQAAVLLFEGADIAPLFQIIDILSLHPVTKGEKIGYGAEITQDVFGLFGCHTRIFLPAWGRLSR